MTNEEAIAYGKRVIDLGLNDETQAFCELALKALEQDDVLREIRQEITELNRYQFPGFGIETYLNAGEVYKILDKKIKELKT